MLKRLHCLLGRHEWGIKLFVGYGPTEWLQVCTVCEKSRSCPAPTAGEENFRHMSEECYECQQLAKLICQVYKHEPDDTVISLGTWDMDRGVPKFIPRLKLTMGMFRKRQFFKVRSVDGAAPPTIPV
jgi:hypothetical protein